MRLRYAVLLRGESIEPWHVACVGRLDGVAELAAVIVAPRDRTTSTPRRGSRLLRWYEGRVGADSTPSVAERFDHVPRHRAESLGSIESGSFDFVLKLGPGQVPRGLEFLARHGVWYFEHEVHWTRLPFFREVYEGEAVTHAALLSTSLVPGHRAILEQAFFKTEQRSYATSRDRVLESVAGWPARVCSRIHAGASVVRDDIAMDPGLVEVPPRLFHYLTRVTRRRLAFGWGRLARHPQWSIGILNVSAGELVDAGAYREDEIKWLPLSDRRKFFADPFGIVRDGVLHILCESFSYRESRGDIRQLEVMGGGAHTTPKHALALTGHASYPFLFEADDEIYCVPETSAANEVALFRAVDFPREWRKADVLLSGFPGVDPTVFVHEGRWWLLCTRKGALEDVELWAWYSSSVFGPWIEHAHNPIKSDVRGSRPGGRPFHHKGVLYRPAQDCSRTYGWRVTLQRVSRLTPTEFREEPLMVMQASPQSRFPVGRHTLTPVGDMLLLDGRRDVFVWGAFRAFMKIWAADLAAKTRRRRGTRPT